MTDQEIPEHTPQWQPIETAPKDGSVVMLADADHVTMGSYHSDVGRVLIASDEPYWQPYDHSCWDRFDDDDWFEPTHWMPLLAPPVKAGGAS